MERKPVRAPRKKERKKDRQTGSLGARKRIGNEAAIKSEGRMHACNHGRPRGGSGHGREKRENRETFGIFVPHVGVQKYKSALLVPLILPSAAHGSLPELLPFFTSQCLRGFFW
mmetsp:Transcript_43904/g.86648  ORF Transcript_43904/g.86648 Transcript_43904/m.86648 type:complete len:114 (-) Transcript_43904:99-440(-)